MPAKPHSELKAGFFVIVSFAVLLAVVLWLGAADIFKPVPHEAVFFVSESAGSVGLKVGSVVQVNDTACGKIVDIRFSPAEGRTLYFAEINRPDIEIHSDGKAMVPGGLVGDMPLVITSRGTPGKPPADENNPIEISGLLQRTMSNIEAMSEQIRDMVNVNQDNVNEIMDNFTQVSANLKSASKEIRRNPWRLLYKPKKGELHSQNIYDAARAFSEGAGELDQAVAKLGTLVKMHPEGLPADDPQMIRIRKRLDEVFNRFTEAEEALWKALGKNP
ncbi:MAG: hypothetical protein ISS78_01150 [Phycisphaerae bacterium]|nr:hypothetical protein [Phycisphaerae bacterium]